MKRLIKGAIRRAFALLLPRRARNSLRLWTLLDLGDRAPTMIEQFDASPVLVLAPHMDDEVIGPGGALRRHVLAGAPVSVVFMTDGRHGNPELYKQGFDKSEIVRREGELVVERKSESQKAAQILGLGELIFLDGPDGSLSESPDLVERLARVLNEKKPAYVYLPALSDLHADHWATNRLFKAALEKAPAAAKTLTIRGYEVWTPLLANRMLDITSTIAEKRQAIAAFASQTRFVDYDHVAIGLNAYRSMMHLHGRGYAEGFFEMTPAEFGALYDLILCRSKIAGRP